MDLQEMKCKNCGGVLEVDYSYNRATCKYCGTNYYLEKNSNNKPYNSNLEDYPASINIVICENDLPLKIADRFEFVLRVIAGLAYCLKKSYKVDPIVFNDGDNIISLLRDNYCIDKRDLRKKINDQKGAIRAFRSFTEDHKEQITFLENIPYKYEERSRKNSEYMKDLVRRLKACGVTVTERKKIISDDSPVKMTCEQHTIIGTVPMVKPDYFSSYFNNAYTKYLRIKNLEVTAKIAAELSHYIHYLNNSITSGVILGLEVWTTGCELKRIFYKNIQGDGSYAWNTPPSRFLTYHSFGMSNIEASDIDTLSALAVALIEKMINTTQQNGRDVLDFSSSYKIPYNDEESPYNESSFTIPLRYLKESEKSYNQW